MTYIDVNIGGYDDVLISLLVSFVGFFSRIFPSVKQKIYACSKF
jgi:hypothetical protein